MNMMPSNLGFDRALTREEEKKFFSAQKSAAGWVAKRDLHAFGLMRNAGLRVGTVVGLTVGDAQDAIAEGQLVLRAEICKRGKGYKVEVTRDVEKHLQGLLAVRRDRGAGLDRQAPLVLGRESGDAGKHVSVRTLQLRAEHWRVAAGITRPISPHWFRHTLGQRVMRTTMLPNPLQAVARALGQSSLASAAIYSQPSRDEMRAALMEASA